MLMFFDVQKTFSGLELVGKEKSREVFRTRITDSNFSTFSEFERNRFYSKKGEEGLFWTYASETDEAFELLVKQNSNMSLIDSLQNYTGFDQKKSYAFRTPRALENQGNLAFYNIITEAQQFHNYGTLQSFTCMLAQNYLFNSGVLRFGKVPIEAVDLRAPFYPLLASVSAKPKFQ